MATFKTTSLAGIATLLIIMSSGITYYIQDDVNRNYGTCSEGWKLQDDGTYICTSRGITGEYCFSTTATRCYYGVKIKTENPTYNVTSSPTSKVWSPTTINNKVYWVKDDATYCYQDGLIDKKVENCREIK